MALTHQTQYDKQVASWLLLCAAVIFGMILLGGVTRLTNSGLSMVEWKPLMGVVPPMSEQGWQDTFDKYKQYPEYQKVNRGMSMGEFKYIFMYEYLHRVLGRLIGVLYFLPMLFFLLKGRVRAGLAPRLWILFLMGGFQGALGWYIVKSGLVDDPRVSQYRLTAHLGVAVAIYAYMLWLAFSLLLRPRGDDARNGGSTFAGWALALVGLVYLMILSGGLVAGTDAGFSYSTWPLMGPTFMPDAVYAGSSAWLDAFEDITTIQFNHRMFAYFLFALINIFGILTFYRMKDPLIRLVVSLVVVALWVQVGLGISTLLWHVPVPLAAAHQGGAVVLLSATLLLANLLRRRQQGA